MNDKQTYEIFIALLDQAISSAKEMEIATKALYDAVRNDKPKK